MSQHTRSSLFTPADSPEMMEKAADTVADGLIFDLEDAVPASKKETARKNLQDILAENDFGQKQVATRINGLDTEYWLGDLKAAVEAGVDSVSVPKIETARDVHVTVKTLSQLSNDPPAISIGLESPTGVFNGQEIAQAATEYPNVTSIGFGIADYCRAIGAPEINPRVRDFLSHLIIGYATIGGLSASASTHLDVDDDDGLRERAEQAQELGYTHMSAIHPQQLEIINDVFTPSEEQVNFARKLVNGFDASEKDSLLIDGVFLDTATVDRYRDLIERYEQIQGSQST